MSLYKVTYYRFKKEEMEGVDKHEENVDDSIVYLIRPSIFSTSAYEIDYYYTWENNAIGKIYKPGSKIEPDSPDMFTADTTLYAAWKKSNAGALILINEGVETDISDLLYGADVIYGKNQPFPYGEVEISKQMFNSDDYWASRAEMEHIAPYKTVVTGSGDIGVGISFPVSMTYTRDSAKSGTLVIQGTIAETDRVNDFTFIRLKKIENILGVRFVKTPKVFGSWTETSGTVDFGYGSKCDIHDNIPDGDLGIGRIYTEEGNYGRWPSQVLSGKMFTITLPGMVEKELTKPDLIQGSTKIQIGVYGIRGEWEFQKTKDDGQKYSLVCVHPAHRLKDLKLDTLFEVKDYNEGGPSVKFPNIFGDAPFALNPNSSITGPPKIWKITDFMGSGVTVYVEVGVPTSPTVSRIEGTHANIFKLLVHLGLGIDYSDMKVDAGTTYTSQGYTFNTTYTTEEMSSLKANKAPIASNTNLSTTALRAQGNAWEALLSLGYMVNADIFFYDKAYFVDYQSPDTVVDKLHLNYGNEAVDGWVTEEIINIVENKDQGSQAIQTAQTVHSENYSTSISVSGGANTIIEGNDVKFLIPDYIPSFVIPSSKDHKIYQIKTIALNLLLKNYKPGDVVSYSVSEVRRADVEYGSEVNIHTITDKDVGTIAQVGSGYFADYYICVLDENDNKIWVEYKFHVNPQRREKYSIYSLANNIKDTQNNLELTDTKLALTHISYPSCVTTYVWGNPEFLDAEQAMTDVEMGVADATISGTDDTQISDKYSAMMVYGNLGVSELDEERTGFTGMILEKNWDKELYRFAGYKDKQIRAMFDTDGRITAGGGDVALDEEGLTVLFDKNYTGESYQPQSALKFKCRQDEAWTSASLYSSVLNVILPPNETVTRENLTALTLNNGPAPSNIKSNLLLATSGARYGANTNEYKTYPQYVPHCFRFGNDSAPLTTMFPDFEQVLSDDSVYIGYNPSVFPSKYFNVASTNLDSGFKISFTIVTDAIFAQQLTHLRFTNLQFEFGGVTINLDLGNYQPTSNETIFTYTLNGVFRCDGPYSLNLSYTDTGSDTTPTISRWAVGIFGWLTVGNPSDYISDNIMNMQITDDRWGGDMGTLNVGESITLSHNSSNSIYIQPATNSMIFTDMSVASGEVKGISVTYNDSYHIRCRSYYNHAMNKSLNSMLSDITGGFGTVTIQATSVGGVGSMIFLRNEGGYIFGDLNIVGGQYANLSFKKPTEEDTVGGIFLNGSTIRGKYGSDMLPEASALEHIGSMMYITRINSVASGTYYPSTPSKYPTYVMLVHQHQHLRVSLRNPLNQDTQIYESGDNLNGDGQNTASFFVPAGWKWVCSGNNAKYATTFHFVGAGL